MALLVEGKRRAAETAQQDRAWLAWTIAALGRTKKMPPLKDLTGKPRREAKRGVMTGDQMLAIARMWTAAVGAPDDR